MPVACIESFKLAGYETYQQIIHVMHLPRYHTGMLLCMITYSALFQVFNNLKNYINTNYATVFCNIQYEACEAIPDHNQKMSDGISVPTEFRGLNIWKSLGVNCREGGP